MEALQQCMCHLYSISHTVHCRSTAQTHFQASHMCHQASALSLSTAVSSLLLLTQSRLSMMLANLADYSQLCHIANGLSHLFQFLDSRFFLMTCFKPCLPLDFYFIYLTHSVLCLLHADIEVVQEV